MFFSPFSIMVITMFSRCISGCISNYMYLQKTVLLNITFFTYSLSFCDNFFIGAKSLCWSNLVNKAAIQSVIYFGWP